MAKMYVRMVSGAPLLLAFFAVPTTPAWAQEASTPETSAPSPGPTAAPPSTPSTATTPTPSAPALPALPSPEAPHGEATPPKGESSVGSGVSAGTPEPSEAGAMPAPTVAPAPPAAGTPPAADAPGGATPSAPDRRGGVVAGMAGLLGGTSGSGYPNKALQIDDPAFYQSSGPSLGGGAHLFFMGALAPYLNFGFWFGGTSSESSSHRTSVGGGGLRIEAFPLENLAPAWKNLGIASQMGFGITSLSPKTGTSLKAEGVQSYFGLGVFHEWTLLQMGSAHIAGGPALDYGVAFSRSVTVHSVGVGGRIVLYTSN